MRIRLERQAPLEERYFSVLAVVHIRGGQPHEASFSSENQHSFQPYKVTKRERGNVVVGSHW